MVELSFKNDICIGIKYVWFFSIFQIYFNKNANAKRLSMRCEKNPLIFQPNPESFCRAIIFSSFRRHWLLMAILKSSMHFSHDSKNAVAFENDCRILFGKAG
jgi:hypothetical protein